MNSTKPICSKGKSGYANTKENLGVRRVPLLAMVDNMALHLNTASLI